MFNPEQFRVLLVDLTSEKSRVLMFGDRTLSIGGCGLAAELYTTYGKLDEPYDCPDQPLIFAIGPLTAYFPLMSKCVMGFKSPYNNQYTESHAGGRAALSMRFAGYDAIIITGKSSRLACAVIGGRHIEIKDVHYLSQFDVLGTGKHLRRIFKSDSGHRSLLRIGPAGENQVSYAAVNVDTYRHFGRMGGGAAMGAKNLKAIMILGDTPLDYPKSKTYPTLYKSLYEELTLTPAMKKYHDLGTPENLIPLNTMKALPWKNLQETSDEGVGGISGERFADELLLRKTACAGCPVGCIHVGLLREKFAVGKHEFLYRQVSYDFEPIFADGTMLGIKNAAHVLLLIEEFERQGLDVMSGGVALAWATEAYEKNLITDKETLTPLQFGDAEAYQTAIRHLGARTNDFYYELGRGSANAAEKYGGSDFACVLGQEMAGYATGEVFFVSQAYGFRHSHLDTAGYSFDQKNLPQDAPLIVQQLLEEERRRIELTTMVSCLFARSVYTHEKIQEALESIGLGNIGSALNSRIPEIQAHRWRLKFQTGYDPALIQIPKRIRDVVNWKGPIDQTYMSKLAGKYNEAIIEMAG